MSFSKLCAALLSLVPLALLLHGEQSWLGAEINYPWFPALTINFHLGVDGLSLVFLYLTAIVVPISILAFNEKIAHRPTLFYAFVLTLELLLLGFFTAKDLALFTFFWEAMLLPLYFIISLWGGPQRLMAAMKFLIYMIAGSVLMVAAVLALYLAGGTFDIATLAQLAGGLAHAPLLCGIFLIAFAVKTPLFPFHAWLPDAYCQAPTAGTILLAGLLSKAGIYGIARVGLPFFASLIVAWSPWLTGLAIAGVFYGGLTAWREKDFKRLIAYSSLAHVNFILVGLFVWSEVAHTGALIQALNHGVTITGLFLVAGWLEERLGTTAMGEVHGLAKFLPRLCWLTLLFVLSSVALPGTNSFVGELLILFGLFGVHPYLASFLALTVILSVLYMLRFMQEVYFQTPTFFREKWIDINARQLALAMPLVALILWMGLYPKPVLEQLKTPPATYFMEKNR